MRENYFSSNEQYVSLSNNPIASYNARYHKKYTYQKLLTQESSIKGAIFSSDKPVPQPHNSKNISIVNQSTKSQQFINTHVDKQHPTHSYNKMAIHSKLGPKQSQGHLRGGSKEGSNDLLAKRSVQVLIGLHKGINKTQYSKINRRKEELFKRNVPFQREDKQRERERQERQETVIYKIQQDFAEDKLIERYRQLLIKKQNGQQPFNMINKLYQIQALSSKQTFSIPKEGIKVVPNKLTQKRKNSQIQYQISKIIHKPAEIKAVKEMLVANSHPEVISPSKEKISDGFKRDIKDVKGTPKVEKQSLSEIKRQDRELKYKSNPVSRELKKDIKPFRSIKKDYDTSIDCKIQSTHRISEPKIKIETCQKIQPTSSQQISNTAKNEPQNQQQSQPQILYPPPKKVTATAYIIYQILQPEKKRPPNKKTQFQTIKRKQYPGKIHSSLCVKTSSEIASLTKIMTCILIIQICDKNGINARQEKYKVGCFQAFIGGTTAQIQVGDIYTIDQLLRGLMLPSGNDASLALARWAGNVLILTDQDPEKRKGQVKYQDEAQYWAKDNKFIRYKCQKFKPKRCYNRFLAQMNKKTRLLGLERTSYMNSHGLANPHNKSSCLDLAMLCEYCIKNPYFCEIVSCKQYQATIDQQQVTIISKRKKKVNNFQDPEQNNLDQDADEEWNKAEQDDQDENDDMDDDPGSTTSPSVTKAVEKKIQIVKKQIQWTNTHKLMASKQQYLGIKTGVTSTAGPCLASYLKIQQRQFIIVVLNSKKLNQRFVDTQILRSWLCKKEKLHVSKSALDKMQ